MADMHPQNNFTSEFSEEGGSNAVLTVNVNGETRTTYTPDGGDQSINLVEPVIFEMNDHPTYAEINPVVGLHVPVYLHVSGGGIDYMVPYIGQESGGEGLRFAIPDSQNKSIKYWICRNGASWITGEDPLDIVFTNNFPTFAKVVAAAATKRPVTYCSNGGSTYILTVVAEHYAVFSTVNDATVTSIILNDDDTTQTKTYDFRNYEPRIGFVNGHFATSPSTQYLKICEFDYGLESSDGQTTFAITIPASIDSNGECESGVFEVGYSGATNDITVTGKWLSYKKGAGLIDRVTITVSSDSKKLEVWLQATKINFKNVYVRALTNEWNFVLSDLYQGNDYRLSYPNTSLSMSGTGWDTTGTVYEFVPPVTNELVIINWPDISNLSAGERAGFVASLISKINNYHTVIEFVEDDPNDPSLQRHYHYQNYIVNDDITTFNFQYTYIAGAGYLGMNLAHIAYDSSQNTITKINDTATWAVTIV